MVNGHGSKSLVVSWAIHGQVFADHNGLCPQIHHHKLKNNLNSVAPTRLTTKMSVLFTIRTTSGRIPRRLRAYIATTYEKKIAPINSDG